MAAPSPTQAGLKRTAALGLVAALLCGCTTTTSTPATSKGGPREAAKHLFETDLAFSQTSARLGVAEAFYLYLADNAVWLPTGGEPVLGRLAVREALRSAGAFQLTWQPQAADVSRSGDLGYTWGFYESRWQAEDGREHVTRGKYTSVWRRQPDGAWKAVLDMGNPTMTEPAR